MTYEFQIRHRGVKGVLSVDPMLDERSSWARNNNVEDSGSVLNDLSVVFRPSQDKFEAPEDEHIEIVKYSVPTPVSLCRPLISILDQVSFMQGLVVHRRVTKRIHDLLDEQLSYLVNMLTDEEKI
ncbi:unnamed protein product [Gongylonema pulchrum]|uniref:RNA-dependent RNA polymerase n=1 Tax=Gongylonema pulchrum TaxID=637853 RepID=A0A3P7PEA4_9BILA|nr:unnamed protein product [Gongylonema pulchrum]